MSSSEQLAGTSAEKRQQPGAALDDAAPDTPAPGTQHVRGPLSNFMGDVSGAFADLGTFLPLALGVFAVNQFNPVSVLFGFGCFALATAIIYRRPVPVQPMKAVAAVVIATGLSAESVAAAGLILGSLLVILALTGAVERLNRAIPQSVLAGVALGIGVHLVFVGLRLVSQDWVIGIAIFAFVAILLQTRAAAFSCMAGLAVAIAWGLNANAGSIPAIDPGLHFPSLVIPTLSAFREAAETVVIPQFMLTIANAILATAAIAASLFPEDHKRNITPRRLAMSTGGLNLVLAPFGVLPMCHGAGGLIVQHKFGARTGLAPAIFGLTCLGLGVFLGSGALTVLAILPLAAVGALLVIAGGEMALNKRLFDGRPSCLVVIVITAATCVFVNVAVGVIVGLAAEFIRSNVVRWLRHAGTLKS